MTDLPPVSARLSRLPAWLRAMRPRQWVKNVLVFAAPLAAGRLFDPFVIRQSLWAFLAFCLVSSSVYLMNDIRDVEADRLHPTKRFRPLAAAEISARLATVLAIVCLVTSVVLAIWVAPLLGVTIATYFVLQICYTVFLKHQPVIDLAIVASGFLLRAIAGGVAPGLELSMWFLLVASFGSLFMVAGKRYSELVNLGPSSGTRPSLANYTEDYLRVVWGVSLALVIMSYSLWTFDHRGKEPWGIAWTAISIAPFTLALFRYALSIDAGKAGEPEDVVFHDGVLQFLAVLWVIPLGIAVFVR